MSKEWKHSVLRQKQKNQFVEEGSVVVPVNMEPGDILFFNGSTIHGSYPNRSKDRFRRSFTCY